METNPKPNPPFPLGQKGQQINVTDARFFIVHRTEGSFAAVSPFLVDKCLMNCVGEIKSVKKLRSGDLLVEVSNKNQGMKLLQCSMFGSIPVVVSAHSSLNFSRGVISEAELLNVPEEEILDGLDEQNVCGVRRITIRRDGKILRTKHLILTFNSPTLPSSIKAGYLRCPVRPFIPNPLRCFQCQRFGHSKGSCRGSAVCPRCAEPDHDGSECKNTVKCVNCKGDHTAFSRDCPTWKKEKEIQVIKVKDNISFPEARKRVELRTPRAGLSYAAAVKQHRSICTQTDGPEVKNSPQKKSPNAKSSRSNSPKTKQKPLKVQSVFVQKPLNEPLPKSKLLPKLEKVKISRKSRKTSPSPSKQRIPKHMKNSSENINRKLKQRKQKDGDSISLYPSDVEDLIESDVSEAAMELSEIPTDAKGVSVPLPSSPC